MTTAAVTCTWCHGPRPVRAKFCSVKCRVAAWRECRRYNGAPPAWPGRNRDLASVTPPAGTSALPDPVTVAALYVRGDGHYTSSRGVEPWTEARDATRYKGPWPVIAHPPCAPWGRYRTIAPTRQRADLAVRAVDQVRWFGGVLEHPAESRLWAARDMPRPGEAADQWGGWTLLIRQSWWGHRAPKPTWLYIVGRRDVPALPPPAPDPGGRIEDMSERDRELTPAALADWLISLARGCVPNRYRRARRGVTSPIAAGVRYVDDVTRARA